MKNKKTYYKVLDKNNCAKNGGNFDYNKYIKSGKPVPEIKELNKCSSGYHLTEYWNMWNNSEDERIYEVEPIRELIENNVVGVVDKIVCESFRFIKEIIPTYNKDLNTGVMNTGNNNTGNSNTGYSNTGYSNTGNSNTGNSNTGYSNTGDSNTGDSNTGYSNTGDSNTGYRNTGYRNTGNSNTGNSNTGNSNTGNRNTGNRNTGNWNTGDSNTGSLNTIKPEYTQLFNKDILMVDYEKIVFPNYFYFELEKDYKESWIKSFNKATKKDVEDTIKLPNFSYKIFEEISGITEEMITERLK